MKPDPTKAKQLGGLAVRASDLQLLCSQAETLRKAKGLAPEVGCSGAVGYGFPIVWTSEHALVFMPSGVFGPDNGKVPLCGPIALSREVAIKMFSAASSKFLQLGGVLTTLELSLDIRASSGLLQRIALPCIRKSVVAPCFVQTPLCVFAVCVASVVDSHANFGMSAFNAA